MTNAGRLPRVGGLVGAALLLAPSVMLMLSALQLEGPPRSIALGVSVTLAIEGLFLLTRYGPQRAMGSLFAVLFYGVCAGVMRFNSPDLSSAATHGLLAASILVPVGLFLKREVSTTGGNARRAKFLIRQLLARREWPIAPAEYRTCPLIAALREVLRENAAPVLPLLAHEDRRVQLAVLSALEFHPEWRKGQAEPVFQLASASDDTDVRVAAVLALANVKKSRHLNALLPFMRDYSEQVRRAATTAVLHDAAQRWPEIRGEVRQALAAPHAAKDGPLPCSGALSQAALEDLVNWSVESGPVGKRSTQTVVRHCKKAIHEDGSTEAIRRVSAMITNPKVPAGLRVELAHRLQVADVFPVDVASRLLGPANPTMLRVLAAGAILSHCEDPAAVEVLREACKQPNREITLASASLVQKYLSVDLGLPVGGALPATNSREAAEIARRVLRWASDPGSQVGAETPADAVIHPADAAYF
jgi:hypothetical protein